MLKPQTLYNWFYRPDYQFSVYDQDLKEINLVGKNPDTGEETLTDIKPSHDPKITGAVYFWTAGLDGHTDVVPVNIYPEDTHTAILTLAGMESNVNTDRRAFLTGWITEESSYHWGNNSASYQSTPYRLEEGGADEHGSLSFSQLLYGKRYGNVPCAVHDDAQLNLYNPKDQVKTFVLHTASNAHASAGQAVCPGGFYSAFRAGTFTKTFNTDTAPFLAGQTNNVNDLRGFRHGTGAITPVPASEDRYDLLSKAIAGYNGANTWITAYSFAKLLKYKRFIVNSSGNTGTTCHSCRYAIQAKQHTFNDQMRTYIWSGGTSLVTIENPLAGEEGQPPTTEVMQEWCFEYGESDWVAYSTETVDGLAAIVYGPTFEQAYKLARDKDDDGVIQTPIGRTNCS